MNTVPTPNPLPNDLPRCGEPAAHRIEAAADAHGNLDASVYVCAGHLVPAAWSLTFAGFTSHVIPHRPAPMGQVKRCGDGMDYTGPTAVALTAPTAGQVPAQLVDEQTDTDPAWSPLDGPVPVDQADADRALVEKVYNAGQVYTGRDVLAMFNLGMELGYRTARRSDDQAAKDGGRCPLWCTLDHGRREPADVETGSRLHSRTLLRIDHGDQLAVRVEVSACEDLDGVDHDAPAVSVEAKDVLTAAEARQAAAALLRGADLLDGVLPGRRDVPGPLVSQLTGGLR
ncbi:DUF6907 domain-containing protein [Micromonospora sp. NBC_01813]|uniref:DUF6907 domain-containing protein n=1 Tax=Micromonospora sp. NBC_01813 TaxID=2975988 RepID=UPI002DD8731A|nr:hypothetical protein [Micromonospora sp. NBC_01813]WSA07087.1 hypothetical protein OG958_22865 [Micromonospora sp. NBC_01813]